MEPSLRRWRGPLEIHAVAGIRLDRLRSTVPADADLFASIRLVDAAPPLTTYAVEIVVEGGLALSGTIGTYLTD